MVEQSMGIIGLGVMGRNLALNLADKGICVAAYDPWTTARDNFAAAQKCKSSTRISLNHTLSAFTGALPSPRILLIMMKAGEPVDHLIRELTPLLTPGDIIIDGGNSHYPDSIRLAAELKQAGLSLIDLGVSGGEDGARLPTNLIQAQRDYFGAHSYERTDRPGSFHTAWAALAESRI